MKTCYNCCEVKPISQFNNCKRKADGLSHLCKQCSREHNTNYYRTPIGLVANIYNNQRKTSRKRGFDAPTYTLKELHQWIREQMVFAELFQDWIDSGFNRDMSPSIDRKDDYIGYTLDNIQMMTAGENIAKGHSDMKNGINNKQNKIVIQTTLDGEFIEEYHSAQEASRQTGFFQASISRCCRGERTKANGFKWNYA